MLNLDVAEAARKAGHWVADGARGAAAAAGRFDDSHGHFLTRTGGALLAVAGTTEALAGAALAGVGGAASATGVGAAPGIPAMIGGGLLAVNGADQAQAGLRTLITGKAAHTLAGEAGAAAALGLGASEQTAHRIETGVELTQGVVGLGVGAAIKIAARGTRAAAEEVAGAAKAGSTAEQATAATQAANETKAAAEETLVLARDLAKIAPNSPEYRKLIEEFAKQSTHVKPPPDRVVLGKWDRYRKRGYIEFAEEQGGVWYDPPKGSYSIIGDEAAWEANKAFLRQQMEKGIPKLEFSNMKLDKAFPRVVKLKDLPGKMPGRIKEVQFLEENAAQYGYVRVGNSYVKAP